MCYIGEQINIVENVVRQKYKWAHWGIESHRVAATFVQFCK